MAKGPKKKAEEPAASPLTIDGVTDAALERFQTKVRERIPRDEVRAIVAKLDLAKMRSTRKVPRLLVRRLKFVGTKVLKDVTSPIDYDQEFQSGVNALVIEDNLVGKSSVLKTIKFALTGSYDEYDQEVRKWITDIWLQFSLDDRRYTVLLGWRKEELRCVLVPEDHTCLMEDVPKAVIRKGFQQSGDEEVQAALGAFFVNEFELAALGWNRAHPTKGKDSIDIPATWPAYFQALRILDDNHTYLLCKPEYANQDRILFSAFLGLHLSEPLNQLSMEAAAIRKRQEATATEAGESAEKRAKLVERREKLRKDLAALDADQAKRLEVIKGGDLTAKHTEAQGKLIEANTEVTEIEEQQQTLNTQMKQHNATARLLREQIDLSRELTGLDVSICPSCARGIDPEALEREKTVHQCRLCVRPVPTVGADDAAQLEAAAKDRERLAAEIKERLPSVARDLAEARKKAAEQRAVVEALRASITDGMTKGFPTPEENERRGKMHEEIGEINHEVTALDRVTGGGTAEDHERKLKIIEKVQLVLKEEAEERNKEIEAKLNELATEVIKALGADQITGIKCYASGLVKLTKNDELVSFSNIKNPGERYRAKLALFLAMMRLGCEAGVGRHPGFLMLDQLGTAELVPEALKASAVALKQIEDKYAEHVQIICFTAKPEFRKATITTKVYGHRAVTSGKKCAF
ncbi:hypothetical protein VT84_06380 [Gemmata sp. SH-PL17]|uniref:hypothetical protein n=1 Tax=Gemmata sp. SH-PL17 TaxID=1630693 RepID=UPI00078EBD92|nr:hypothetical protein [Gemmata sp. SH-PL17]AMV24003.1 hypothetical protein VT84_06380 [Gemmata sp. SH-PL17]